MTDNELDQLMQRVLLDAIKKDCETENSVVPSFNPSPRYQRSLVAMIADPLKWTRKRATPLWKKILQKVAIVLIVFSLSLGSLMAVSPNIRAAVVNWVTEWYETHITYRYLGTPTDNGMPKYRIEALPNGYVEVDSEREEWSDYICIVYRNEASGKTIYFDYYEKRALDDLITGKPACGIVVAIGLPEIITVFLTVEFFIIGEGHFFLFHLH